MSFMFLLGLCQSCIMICDLLLLDARLRMERSLPTMVHNPPAAQARSCIDVKGTIQILGSLPRMFGAASLMWDMSSMVW
jgi:hypothetical protein